jgi:hypothetical protein
LFYWTSTAFSCKIFYYYWTSTLSRAFFFLFFCAPGIWDWQGTRTGTLYSRAYCKTQGCRIGFTCQSHIPGAPKPMLSTVMIGSANNLSRFKRNILKVNSVETTIEIGENIMCEQLIVRFIALLIFI